MNLMRRTLAMLILIALAAEAALAAEMPPVASVRPVVDEYHGVKIADPYRYMENLRDPEVQTWIKAQADYAQRTLAGLPAREKLLERIRQLDAGTPYRLSIIRRWPNGDLHCLKTMANENLAKLYFRDAKSGQERLLVDPQRFAKSDKEHYSLSFCCPSPNGRFVAYGVAASGSELTVMHVLDVAAGKDTGDVIDRMESEYTPPCWLADSSGFVYSRRRQLPADAPATEVYKQSYACLHRLGTDPDRDPVILRMGLSAVVPLAETDFPSIVLSLGSQYAIAKIKHGDASELTLYAAPAASLEKGPVAWKKICDAADDVTDFAAHGDEIYLLTGKDAPRYKVVRTSLASPDFAGAEAVVPPGTMVVRGVGAARDALYVDLLDGGMSRVARVPYGRSAKPETIELPDGMPSASVVSINGDCEGALLATQSWTRAGKIYSFAPASRRLSDTGLRPRGAFDDPEGLESVDVLVSSHDGVRVPLSIVYKKGIVLDGSHPTLVSGYGGYGFIIPVHFNPTSLAWLERGGVLAFAHVRGGGEFGREWHLAGRKATKPNTWKDFIACCEYLVQKGYTSPAKLAGEGGSAGGILIGRAITERPDLFAAAIIQVGCLDMLRFETTTNGVPNIPEMGTVKIKEEFQSLLEMSSYHHVKDGTRYPAVLLTHGINDPRVEPWMSAKMTARLQAATSSGKPVIFRVDYQAGHGIGSTKKQRQEQLADEWAFLLWQMGETPRQAGREVKWEPIGLSGGGAMFTPAISPRDGRCMMVNCDMSAAYITTDGGERWRMIHHGQLRSNIQCRPAFHPTQRETIFAANGWSGLHISRDMGEHWEPIGNLPHDLRGEIAIDPGKPDRMLAGTSREVWRSMNGGRSWSRCAGPKGIAVAFHFDQTSGADQRVCFAATSEGIWRSDDGGSTWKEKCSGLPWQGIRSFAGGSDVKSKQVILYCAIPSKVDDSGKYAGGVYRSTNRGESWQSVMGGGLNVDTKAADQWAMGDVAQYHRVLTTNVKPSTVWAFNANTGVLPPHHTAAYRSDDGGKTWRPTFYPDPRFKQCNVELDYMTAGMRQFYQDIPEGAAIDPSNPDHVVQVDGGRCYITRDGGKRWTASHTKLTGAADPTSKDAAWLCSGLVVTTTWNYYIDPFQANRHYICYTDIGFARSLDAGASWKWWTERTRSPWSNTCYELAFDPKTPGKIWGAFSNTHDIPNANIISGRHKSTYPGGICLSTDFGASWKPLSGGLPAAPALSVVLDPKSPARSRTLYASMFSQGVYKSTDDGKSWKKMSQGLGAASNMRVCRMQLHNDGTLFVLITALRQNGRYQPEGAGLYRSKDGAQSWELVNASQPLLWPKDFAVDPKDSRIIYIGAADAGSSRQGGLYRSVDGGVSWKLLARKGPEHFGAYLHPNRPGWIYMSLTEGAPGAGLWLSKDNGLTWTAMEGLPFANAQRVAFDPADDSVIYVTTFGGSVWRGPASEQ